MATPKKPAKRAAKTPAAKQRDALTKAQSEVIRWAVKHSAPILLLEGWEPETGTWAGSSPAGQMIAAILTGSHPTVAAELAHFDDRFIDRCHALSQDQPENREYIPIDVRPLVDLSRLIRMAAAQHETNLVAKTNKFAHEDGKLGLAFLGRRYPARWREQQSVGFGVDDDERDAAVARAVQDPNVALALAAIADQIEDSISDPATLAEADEPGD